MSPADKLFRFSSPVLILLIGCSGGSGTDNETGREVNFIKRDDTRSPELVMDVVTETVNQDKLTPDQPDKELPPVQPGCGNGVCNGAETPLNCAKDCLAQPETAAFVFAHKGEELPALARIYDLIQSGSNVFVFYLTFDETPLDVHYGADTGKLAVASVGVPPENIYVYEQYIDWNIFSGNHEILKRLTQHFITHEPDSIYLPQLCGGELEVELAHVVGRWAAKRAKVFPTYYEIPARSNYYLGSDADPETATTNPDGFVTHFTNRWRMIPKDTEELKPTLGSGDMAQIRIAAGYIINDWLQEFLYKLPEDKLLFLLREIQRYRQLPPGQKPDTRPYLESLENPGAKYLYEEQGFTFDEFTQQAAVIESFYGTNLRTIPSALPHFDEPVDISIMSPFEVVMEIRSFSLEDDELTFTSAFDEAKRFNEHCTMPEPVQILPGETLTQTIQCQAKFEIGEHTLYFRTESKLAKENNDTTFFTEVPFRVFVGN